MATNFQFNAFDSPKFDTRIKSFNVQNKERWLGFFLGPALVACISAICGQAYLNAFYTDVLNLSPVAGGAFLALMPIISKILDAITNIFMGRIIDKTKSRQGKARPWILVSGPLLAVSAILLFVVPNNSLAIKLVWVTASYNLFFCVSYTMYNISNVLMVPLSTRNNKQRDTLALAQSMSLAIVPGMLVAVLFPMLVLPAIGVDQSKWIMVMAVIGLLCIPATLIQYYYSRERITEESLGLPEQTGQSLITQLKACLASKYWLVIIGIVIIYQLQNNFLVTSTLYYSNWVLGTYNDGSTMMLLSMIGQAPLGLGIFILWPLVKKFGKRNVTLVGCIIGIIGCVICALSPHNMGIVLAGLFIKSLGSLPMTYIVVAMLADALDHVEWVNKFRADGISSAVYSIVFTVSMGISIGIFNLFLGSLGYIAPAADGSVVVQNPAVQNLFIAGMFIIPAFSLFLVAFLISFFHIEKELPQIKADILERHKAEAAARGEVYVSSEEKAQIEQEKLDRIAEEKRIDELKAKCAKSGLNFDAEEAKYQQKLAEKKAKAEAKKRKGKK
jgi:GPH family glycoside/pentoside/hexuronide:cation symporter